MSLDINNLLILPHFILHKLPDLKRLLIPNQKLMLGLLIYIDKAGIKFAGDYIFTVLNCWICLNYRTSQSTPVIQRCYRVMALTNTQSLIYTVLWKPHRPAKRTQTRKHQASFWFVISPCKRLLLTCLWSSVTHHHSWHYDDFINMNKLNSSIRFT